MAKVTSKIKTGINQATTMKGIPRVILHLAIGFVVGVIVDMLLQALVGKLRPAATPENPNPWRLEVGFPFYMSHPDITSIGYDDILLAIVTVLALFTKKFWIVIGFFLGWYISSDQDLYGTMVAPFLPEG